MNIALSILTLIVVALFVLPNLLMASAATDITQNDFINRQKADNNFLLVDVRTTEEFNKGHIKGAININHSDIEQHLSLLPKDKDLILYCRSGRRVGIAANLLAKHGYEQLFHLKGDITAWNKNNRPLTLK